MRTALTGWMILFLCVLINTPILQARVLQIEIESDVAQEETDSYRNRVHHNLLAVLDDLTHHASLRPTQRKHLAEQIKTLVQTIQPADNPDVISLYAALERDDSYLSSYTYEGAFSIASQKSWLNLANSVLDDDQRRTLHERELNRRDQLIQAIAMDFVLAADVSLQLTQKQRMEMIKLAEKSHRSFGGRMFGGLYLILHLPTKEIAELLNPAQLARLDSRRIMRLSIDLGMFDSHRGDRSKEEAVTEFVCHNIAELRSEIKSDFQRFAVIELTEIDRVCQLTDQQRRQIRTLQERAINHQVSVWSAATEPELTGWIERNLARPTNRRPVGPLLRFPRNSTALLSASRWAPHLEEILTKQQRDALNKEMAKRTYFAVQAAATRLVAILDLELRMTNAQRDQMRALFHTTLEKRIAVRRSNERYAEATVIPDIGIHRLADMAYVLANVSFDEVDAFLSPTQQRIWRCRKADFSTLDDKRWEYSSRHLGAVTRHFEPSSG